ncbi:hypothetical protein [Calycomorphotria hydatis]|uniref:Uncharacterized protein n=1 Tax=Calycomorphotria hydatis TaxID=2528027 RepID=A0A517T5A5_9PLAN|nr:hypothetical protein [Calycomorphotria hydatis]QDT63563.1 hypothetical protein V22_07870 [Calycomorphotria hydatis]
MLKVQAEGLFHRVNVPQQFPELQSNTIYSIPLDLGELLKDQAFTGKPFSTKLKQYFELCRLCDLHAGAAVVFQDSLLEYKDLVDYAKPVFNEDQAKSVGKNIAELEFIMSLYETRSSPFIMQRQAYLGWLLTCHDFLEEHDALIRQHGRQISKNGFPQFVQSSGSISRRNPIHSKEAQFVDDFYKFYLHWHLQGMTAPYMPVPLAPQFPSLAASRNCLGEGNTTASVPSIYAITGSGTFLETLEDALRSGSDNDHLSEWMKIVAHENTAKNRFKAFARRFKIQHYWRVLSFHLADEIYRKSGKIRVCLAEYIGVSEDSIRNDERSIEESLGSDWKKRFVIPS